MGVVLCSWPWRSRDKVSLNNLRARTTSVMFQQRQPQTALDRQSVTHFGRTRLSLGQCLCTSRSVYYVLCVAGRRAQKAQRRQRIRTALYAVRYAEAHHTLGCLSGHSWRKGSDPPVHPAKASLARLLVARKSTTIVVKSVGPAADNNHM